MNLEICGGQLKDAELRGEVTPIVEKIEEDEKGYNINKKHRVLLMYVCSFVSWLIVTDMLTWSGINRFANLLMMVWFWHYLFTENLKLWICFEEKRKNKIVGGNVINVK